MFALQLGALLFILKLTVQFAVAGECVGIILKWFFDMSIQGDSRLVYITAGGDFLGLCDQKS